MAGREMRRDANRLRYPYSGKADHDDCIRKVINPLSATRTDYKLAAEQVCEAAAQLYREQR